MDVWLYFESAYLILFNKMAEFVQVSEDSGDESSEPSRLELSFEYLVAKNSLRWITLYTSQVQTWRLVAHTHTPN